MIRFDIYKGDRFGTDIVMFTLVFKKYIMTRKVYISADYDWNSGD